VCTHVVIFRSPLITSARSRIHSVQRETVSVLCNIRCKLSTRAEHRCSLCVYTWWPNYTPMDIQVLNNNVGVFQHRGKLFRRKRTHARAFWLGPDPDWSTENNNFLCFQAVCVLQAFISLNMWSNCKLLNGIKLFKNSFQFNAHSSYLVCPYYSVLKHTTF